MARQKIKPFGSGECCLLILHWWTSYDERFDTYEICDNREQALVRVHTIVSELEDYDIKEDFYIRDNRTNKTWSKEDEI